MWSQRSTRHLSWLIALIGSILIIFGAPNVTHAQENPGLQLSPAVLDVNGQVDETVFTSVKLTNTSPEPLGVQVSPRSLVPEDEPIDASAVDRYDASRWITLPESNFLIDGFQSIDVDVEVNIPKEAVPGGHYAVVVFRIINTEAPDGTGVQVNREAGSVMLISVPGDTQEQAFIRTDASSKVLVGGTFELEQTILNQGNSHFLPIVSTEIKNSDGEIVETVTQPVQLLLPNTQRAIRVEWQAPSSVGAYTAETTMSFGTPSQIASDGQHRFFVVPGTGTLLLTVLFVAASIRLGISYKRSRADKTPKSKKNVD